MDLYLLSVLSFLLLANISFADDLNSRLDCYLEHDFVVNEKNCKERQCIWDHNPRPQGIPICYLDPKKVGYKVESGVKSTGTGLEAELKVKDTAKQLLKSSPQIESLKFEVSYITDRIVRFRIHDSKRNRYEVPVQHDFDLLKKNVRESDEAKRKYSLEVNANKDDFEFSITRKDTKTKLIDTSIGGLVFSDQFIQLATRLASKNIYGFGENTHQTLRHDLNYKTWGMFARELTPGHHNRPLYGVHPFYTVLERDGKSHGVLLLNSNAMEYTFLPEPALSLKTLGGILDFFVFVGESPEHVSQLYTSLIGRTVLPPFWGLGFQLTRYGFKGTQNVREVMERNVKERVPLDVMYIDIDYMDVFKDFTYDKKAFKGLPQLLSDAKNKNHIRWALILDPGIQADDPKYETFTDGYKNDVFMKWNSDVPKAQRNHPAHVPTDKDVVYGRVWPRGPVAFPDFFKNATDVWWQKWIKELHKQLDFDAIWIDMNEPSNLDSNYKCPQNKYDYPPIRTTSIWGSNPKLSQETTCMNTVQGERKEYLHYDVHSLYGLTESKSTQKAVHSTTGKRGFVVSRSSYVSSGRYVAHWLGDNFSNWEQIRNSIIGLLEFNLFGIDFVGADICGFNQNTNPELCRRWSQLGAFYPFSRNHNGLGNIDQDPGVWVSRGHPEVTEAARNALQLRYQLLHYLYTLFYRAHVFGDTVARPLFHEWPQDSNTHNIDQQFLWGRNVLISPFLFEKQKEVKAYLPAADLWYEVRPHIKLVARTGHVSIPDRAPNGAPPVHLRGGSIIPMTSSSNLTTTASEEFDRFNVVVLASKARTASGELFWDDRESIDTIERGKYNLYDFNLHSNCTLDVIAAKQGYDRHPTIKTITIANTDGNTDIVATIDGKSVHSVHNSNGLTTIDINLSLETKTSGHKWTVSWKSTKTNACNVL